jgi:hypothetical protein
MMTSSNVVSRIQDALFFARAFCACCCSSLIGCPKYMDGTLLEVCIALATTSHEAETWVREPGTDISTPSSVSVTITGVGMSHSRIALRILPLNFVANSSFLKRV